MSEKGLGKNDVQKRSIYELIFHNWYYEDFFAKASL